MTKPDLLISKTGAKVRKENVGGFYAARENSTKKARTTAPFTPLNRADPLFLERQHK
jgi:hypothetical protein